MLAGQEVGPEIPIGSWCWVDSRAVIIIIIGYIYTTEENSSVKKMMAANPGCAEEPAALSEGRLPFFRGREFTGIWQSQAGRIALVGSLALLTFCLAGSGWAGDKKVVGPLCLIYVLPLCTPSVRR
jgi:hypothetical protein